MLNRKVPVGLPSPSPKQLGPQSLHSGVAYLHQCRSVCKCTTVRQSAVLGGTAIGCPTHHRHSSSTQLHAHNSSCDVAGTTTASHTSTVSSSSAVYQAEGGRISGPTAAKSSAASTCTTQQAVLPFAAASQLSSNRPGSLFISWVAVGVVLTLAFQRALRWASRQSWGHRLLSALEVHVPSLAFNSNDEQAAGSNSATGSALRRSASRSASPPPAPLVLQQSTSSAQSSAEGETVEWVNMCWRKAWRVYQRGLERWIMDLLQPVFDSLIKDGSVPRFVQRLRIVELTLDHEAPYFTNMRRRYSRKDSDLTGVVDVRYTGGARMLLMLEIGEGRWRFKVPVLVSELDLECQMWIKIRLAPMCPWIGTLSIAFVGPPNVKVQLSPYNRVRLMRVPVVQSFLRKLLTVDLPALMVLPKRLEVNIPPSVTSIAEAAVGRDTIMRAVASAVLQADAVEQALLAALPLGPQTPAGGVTLPEAFRGELDVVLREARNLPVWGFPGQSNPYARMLLGEQAVQSRRDDDTSSPGRHRAPVWNQEFQFLVEDLANQKLEIQVRDSHLTGRVEVGSATLPLTQIPRDGSKLTIWLPLTPPSGYSSARWNGKGPAGAASGAGASSGRGAGTSRVASDGEVLLEVTYKAFEDDEYDSGYREAEAFQRTLQQLGGGDDTEVERITDIPSAAAASSRAAVAASAAISAIAMTKAAAARAAARAAKAAQQAASAAAEVTGLQKSLSPPPLGPGEVQLPGDNNLLPSSAEQGSTFSDGVSQPGSPAVTTIDVGSSSIPSSTDGSSRAIQAAAESLQHQMEEYVEAPGQHKGLNGKGTSSSSRNGSHDDHDDDDGDDDHHHPGGPPPTGSARTSGLPSYSSQQAPRSHELQDLSRRSMSAPGGNGHKSHSATLPAAAQPSGNGSSSVVAEPSQQGAAAATVAVAQILAPPATMSDSQDKLRRTSVILTDPQQRAQEDGVYQQGEVAPLQHSIGSSNGGSRVSISSLPGPSSDSSLPVGSTSSSAAGEQTLGNTNSSSIPHVSTASHISSAAANPGSSSSSGSDVASDTQQEQQPAATSSAGGSVDVRPASHLPLPLVLNRVHDLGVAMGSAWDRGWQSMTGTSKPGAPSGQQQPEGSKEDSQPQGSEAQGAQQQQQPQEGGGSTKTDTSGNWWLGPVFAALSVLTTSRQPSTASSEPDAAARAGGQAAGAEQGPAGKEAGGSSSSSSGSDSSKPWWQFWGDGGSAPQQKQGQEQSAEVSTSNSGSSSSEGPPWWQFWGRGDHGGAGSSGKAAGEGGGDKPVETIVMDGSDITTIIIPPDLPLEEIAKEVARLKEESWRSKEDHVESLWARAVERNDRSWLMLLAFLLTLAIALLSVVAYRLDQQVHATAAVTSALPPDSVPEALTSAAAQPLAAMLLLGMAAAIDQLM